MLCCNMPHCGATCGLALHRRTFGNLLSRNLAIAATTDGTFTMSAASGKPEAARLAVRLPTIAATPATACAWTCEPQQPSSIPRCTPIPQEAHSHQRPTPTSVDSHFGRFRLRPRPIEGHPQRGTFTVRLHSRFGPFALAARFRLQPNPAYGPFPLDAASHVGLLRLQYFTYLGGLVGGHQPEQLVHRVRRLPAVHAEPQQIC
jgi:hypothetical protein